MKVDVVWGEREGDREGGREREGEGERYRDIIRWRGLWRERDIGI